MSLTISPLKDFEALYGPQQVYVGDADLLTQLTDPSYEYLMYSWYESEFDGYYSLVLTRTCYQSQSDSLTEKMITRCTAKIQEFIKPVKKILYRTINNFYN